MGRPHTLGQILIGQENGRGSILLVSDNCRREIFAKDKGIPFRHGSQELNRGIGITGVPHILEAYNTLVPRIREFRNFYEFFFFL
jgi:hypothetical protein